MKKISYLFFLSYFFLGLFFLGGYGVSWDEPVSRLNGVVNLKYLAEQSGVSFADEELTSVPSLYDWKDKDYGVSFELPLVALEKAMGLTDSSDIYHLRHFFNFLIYFFSVVCLYKILINRFKLEGFSLACVVLYVLSPRFFAESFYNSKDIVFLALVIINHYCYLKFIDSKGWLKLVILSIVTGLMIDVRIIGIIFPVYYAASLLWECRSNAFKYILAYAALSIFVVILFFPYLWRDPVGNFLNVIGNMSNFRWRGHVLFDGQYIKSYELPWFYILQWMLITLPFLLVASFIGGLLITAQKIVKFDFWDQEFLRFEGFALYALFTTLSLIWIKKPIMYDGWRQFYFLMFPLFMLMTVGMAAAYLRSLNRRWLQILGAAFFLAHSVYFAHWIYQNHPHQNVYFNFIPGDDLTSKYELDYWGVGNMQALKKILSVDDGEVTISPVSLMSLHNALLKLSAEDRSRIKIIHPNDSPKYLITNYRYAHDRTDDRFMPSYSVLFRVEIDGSRVITVYKKK
jgi:hypothetical protein